MIRETNPSSFGIFSKGVDVSNDELAFLIECEKAKAAHKILRQHKYFYSPLLKGYDETKGILVFEKIEAMEPLSCHMDAVWFHRAGELLALIHTRLHLPEEISIVRYEDKGRKGNVYVHGDFMPNNLCISKGRLVVFDWGVRPWISQVYTMASPVVDLAAFMAPWWVPLWWDFQFPLDKLNLFFQAYVKRAGVDNKTVNALKNELGREFVMHKIYHQKEIKKRPFWKRPLHQMKLVVNYLRTRHGIING